MVETRSLTKHYGRLAALNNCTLRIDAGEVFGLLGPNGSGKTTLLRLLMGYLRPTRGSASVLGLDCYRSAVAVHRSVAYLPGEARLFRQMRGDDVLRFFADLRDGGYERGRTAAQRLRLGLSVQVAKMSTGMRQKLALAVTFSANAPLLVLDEPTSSLDPTVRGEVTALVREAKAAGRTVIFSSHVFSEVEEVCDRVAILRDGQLVKTQTMAEVLRRHRIRARLTGNLPPMPHEMQSRITITMPGDGEVLIETAELTPLLNWLATLPLSEVHIEPVGLRAIYDQFHEPTTP